MMKKKIFFLSMFKTIVWVSLLTSVMYAEPDNGQCPGEIVTELDNIQSDKNITIKSSMLYGWDMDRYTFSVQYSGIIKLKLTSSKNLTVKIGSVCGEETEEDVFEHRVEANQNVFISVYYLSLFEQYEKEGYAYELNIEYIPDNSSRYWTPVKFPAVNITYPHKSPLESNESTKIFDLSFDVNDPNYYLSNASFDMDVKRSGERSVKLRNTNDIVNISTIDVEEGKWYIISGYMRTNTLPHDVTRLFSAYMDGNRNHIHSILYPVISVSKANEWEEFVVPLYVQKYKGIKKIRIFIKNFGVSEISRVIPGDVWIDDLKIFEVKDSSSLFGIEPPSQKQEFNGSKFRIDRLGNWEVDNNGTFEPFFPIIVYPVQDGSWNWQKYKENGFNTVMATSIGEAKKISDLDMYWVWSLYGYGLYQRGQEQITRFRDEYNALKNSDPDTYNKLLQFYWDNENYTMFDSVKLFSDTIKEIDVDENGTRKRPFYMHLSYTTANRTYYNDTYQLNDLQGAYANALIFEDSDPGNYEGQSFEGWHNTESVNFSVFENITNVKTPKSIFVINSPFGDNYLETTMFIALAKGGKGFGFWRDGGSQPMIETKPWWGDFKSIVAKIEQMKYLLREPHWTDWEIQCSHKDDEDGIVVGKRDFERKRHIIVASRSGEEEYVTFTTPDKPIGEVRDFFTGEVVAAGADNSFSITLSPHGNGVYYWKD